MASLGVITAPLVYVTYLTGYRHHLPLLHCGGVDGCHGHHYKSKNERTHKNHHVQNVAHPIVVLLFRKVHQTCTSLLRPEPSISPKISINEKTEREQVCSRRLVFFIKSASRTDWNKRCISPKFLLFATF